MRTNYPSHSCKVNKFITTFAKKNNKMTVERDIAGITSIFALGVCSAVIFTGRGINVPATAAPILLTATATILSILISPAGKRLSHKQIWLAIIMTMICCGAFSGASAISAAIAGDNHQSFLTTGAAGFCRKTKDAIASIPFADKQANAIVTALITGDRSMLSKDTTAAFRESGASHILALSGLHLGIIYGLLKAMLSLFGNYRYSRICKALAIVSACGFYTIATGASASTTRAFLFILLSETATLAGRSGNTRLIFWSAMFIQLAADPLSIKDIGFQLSYAAIFGIAYIYPYLKRFWLEGNNMTSKGLRWIWNSAAMSVACQLTTGSIAWIYFGTFPQYFILTNLIAIPLTGLIIPSSLAVLLLHNIGICPEIMIKATGSMIQWLHESLEIIASL